VHPLVDQTGTEVSIFEKYFRKKVGEKLALFTQNTASKIGLQEKRRFASLKLSNIVITKLIPGYYSINRHYIAIIWRF
jgi:hypothetical protein